MQKIYKQNFSFYFRWRGEVQIWYTGGFVISKFPLLCKPKKLILHCCCNCFYGLWKCSLDSEISTAVVKKGNDASFLYFVLTLISGYACLKNLWSPGCLPLFLYMLLCFRNVKLLHCLVIKYPVHLFGYQVSVSLIWIRYSVTESFCMFPKHYEKHLAVSILILAMKFWNIFKDILFAPDICAVSIHNYFQRHFWFTGMFLLLGTQDGEI